MWLKKQFLLVLIILLLCILKSAAQINTLYLNHKLPQSIHLNPAVGLNCESFFELPVISSIYYGYHNNLFSYKEFLYQRPFAEENDFIDFNTLIDNASRNNRLAFSSNITLLGGGLEYDDYYISGRIAFHLFTASGVPDDFFKATDGNWDLNKDQPRDFNLGNSFLTLQAFTEFSVAVSTSYNEKLRVGGRLKYLQGAANVHTRTSDITLDTEDNPLTLNAQSNIDIRSAIPMQVTEDANGFADGINFTTSSESPLQNYFFNKNRGIAIDAGVIYDYTDDVQFSASALNIGFIRWKSNTQSLKQDGSFVFNGIDLNSLTANTTDQDVINALEDSLWNHFYLSNNAEAYFTLLPLQLMGGLQYHFSKNLYAGITGRTDIHNGNFYPSATFSLRYNPFSNLHLIGSYSIMNRAFNNIGGGAMLSTGIFQFYFFTDMMPVQYARDAASGILVPYNARTMNFHFGINLLFRCSDDNEYRKGSRGKVCPAYN